MFCKSCGKEMNANQAICLSCGVKAGVGENFCQSCGNPIAPGASVCMSCGVSVKNNSLNGNDKILMAVLSFFLGGIGVHNFVMGETKRGITRIVASLCCGLGWILALVDFIKILTDNYVVDTEALF